VRATGEAQRQRLARRRESAADGERWRRRRAVERPWRQGYAGELSTNRRERIVTKKALLIGINDYAPIGPGGPDLRGCVSDARDMANTLNALGIVSASPRSMRILTDQRATRAAILQGIAWLVSGAKKGDTLVFHYSGHGSYVIDTSGDEPDMKDETICPHDYATAGMLKDDDFREVFSTVPEGANLDVVFDSCHSGTVTRSLPVLDVGECERQVVDRYVEPPIDYGFFVDVNPALPARGILRGTVGSRAVVDVPEMNHVLWAGCRDNQTSQEGALGGTTRGVFTYSFCKVLRRAGLGATRRQLESSVSAYIRGLGYSQIPQLEAAPTAIAKKVFA
jgi:hypothetical protein